MPVLFGDTLLDVTDQRSTAFSTGELGVRSFDDTVRRLAHRFYVRSERVTHNSLIAGLGKYTPRPGESWKRPRLLVPVV